MQPSSWQILPDRSWNCLPPVFYLGRVVIFLAVFWNWKAACNKSRLQIFWQKIVICWKLSWVCTAGDAAMKVSWGRTADLKMERERERRREEEEKKQKREGKKEGRREGERVRENEGEGFFLPPSPPPICWEVGGQGTLLGCGRASFN